eukprot:9711-Eustigmatos_ZCMA.PRE.1
MTRKWHIELLHHEVVIVECSPSHPAIQRLLAGPSRQAFSGSMTPCMRQYAGGSIFTNARPIAQ